MNDLLMASNDQKVLHFMARNPGVQFVAGEIQKALRISKGGVNQSLRDLARLKLVTRQKKGRVFLYLIDHRRPLVKQLKVLKNIQLLTPLIDKLSQHSLKLVLFGSCARGEDSAPSDIDLFVLTNSPGDVIQKIIQGVRLSRKIQLMLRNPVAYAEMERREPVFSSEISRGITLWEKKE